MALHKKYLWACLALTFATVVVFYPVLSNQFLNLDDHLYVTKNKHVQSGLNLQSLQWAFTTIHAEFYHPLTWVSLLVDASLYGLQARGYITTNLMLHLLNTLLLFYILSRTTGFLIRSLLVAALFALHPLHVESVAWISDRKDLLCTFFWYAGIYIYTSHLARPRAGKYALLLLAFIFGLLSKPMVITLPFVLLLLDIWPLKRLSFDKNRYTALNDGFALIKEKVPLFLLALAGGLTAIFVQKVGGGLGSVAEYPMALRLSNALVAYKSYVLKTFWPTDLSVFYPYPLDHSFSSIFAASLLLVSVTAFAITQIRVRPYWFVGWFWFLGTMVPAIGIFKIGDFAMADRYTYIPLTGLFIIIIWAGAELIAPRRHGRYISAGLSIAVIVVLAALTSRQITYWRTSETLYRHALAVTENNYMAHYGLGRTLTSSRRYSEAALHLNRAAQLKPEKAPMIINISRALVIAGRLDNAVLILQTCVDRKPANQEARFALGLALVLDNQPERAVAHFRELVRQIQADGTSFAEQLDRDARNAYDRAGIMERDGRIKAAAALYHEAIAIQPDFLPARDRLSRLFLAEHRVQEALATFKVRSNRKWIMHMFASGFDRWKKSWQE